MTSAPPSWEGVGAEEGVAAGGGWAVFPAVFRWGTGGVGDEDGIGGRGMSTRPPAEGTGGRGISGRVVPGFPVVCVQCAVCVCVCV